MATADQIKSLIQSHFDRNEERFRTLALQLAAYEAKQGHTKLAREIRTIIDKAGAKSNKVVPLNKELNELVQTSINVNRLSELVVTEEIKSRVERIIKEYRQRDKLKNTGWLTDEKYYWLVLQGPENHDGFSFSR